jgi:integrase
LDFNLFIRIGELAGLKWENIDFIKRTVYICHQITYEPELDDELNLTEKKMVTENYLKGCTSQGFRTEHLRDEAIEILKRAKEINPDGEFVFMPNGKPIITLTFNKRLKKYCEEAGIPYHSSHKIRFYACSTAYNGENLPQLSRMMGHSQVSTTLHYLRNVDKENTFAEVFKNLGNSH